jgi:hypothetical protein
MHPAFMRDAAIPRHSCGKCFEVGLMYRLLYEADVLQGALDLLLVLLQESGEFIRRLVHVGPFLSRDRLFPSRAVNHLGYRVGQPFAVGVFDARRSDDAAPVGKADINALFL